MESLNLLLYHIWHNEFCVDLLNAVVCIFNFYVNMQTKLLEMKFLKFSGKRRQRSTTKLMLSVCVTWTYLIFKQANFVFYFRIGIRSQDLEDSFEKFVKGSSIALSSPRLVIPAVIYGLWGLSQHFTKDIFDFQVLLTGTYSVMTT